MCFTVAALRRDLARYPAETLVRAAGDALVFTDPDTDGPAAPLFEWVRPDQLTTGVRVRKAGYADTGTIEQADRMFRFVRWDHTGTSWERAGDIGRCEA